MDNFEIDEIEVFVNISISNFNNVFIPGGLSGSHWEQTLYVLYVSKQPIYREASNNFPFILFNCRTCFTALTSMVAGSIVVIHVRVFMTDLEQYNRYKGVSHLFQTRTCKSISFMHAATEWPRNKIMHPRRRHI